MGTENIILTNNTSSQASSNRRARNAQYVLPHDAAEYRRLETQAKHLYAMMNSEIIRAPLSFLQNVLDVGCGTGSVTVSMATRYPSARVIGLDLSPVPHLPERKVPSNVSFVEGDVFNLPTDLLGIESVNCEKFDLIYSRLLIYGITNWPGYVTTCTSLLAPGIGWLEIHEIDSVWYDELDDPISDNFEWLTVMREAAQLRGFRFDCGQNVSKWMKALGLVDIQRCEFQCPLGSEGQQTQVMKEFGKYMAEETPPVIVDCFKSLVKEKGYSEGSFERWIKNIKEDLRPGQGLHMKFYVTYGRRPENWQPDSRFKSHDGSSTVASRVFTETVSKGF